MAEHCWPLWATRLPAPHLATRTLLVPRLLPATTSRRPRAYLPAAGSGTGQGQMTTGLNLMREALDLIAVKLARAIDRLGRFAATHRSLPCLGFTHYQPAQPVTVGKRACLWAYDLALSLADIEHRRDGLALRGLRGATGTQASFLQLCGNDPAKVDALERRFAQLLGWPEGRLHPVCGQTYTRVVDAQVLSSLAAAAAGCQDGGADGGAVCEIENGAAHRATRPAEGARGHAHH